MRKLALLLTLTLLAACEPVGLMPGGALSGDVAAPPSDWGPLDEADVVQLETAGPYSVNIWGVVVDNEYYIASARGHESRWARRIDRRSPEVRLRIEDKVYELQAVVVDDETKLLNVADAFNAKYDTDAEADFPDVIVYRLEPRT